MITITKYISNNGIEFTKKQDALDQDLLIELIGKITTPLLPKKKDTGCDFENGYYFIQQDLPTVLVVRRNLLLELQKHSDHKFVSETLADDNIHPSYVGRLLGENYYLRPISEAWQRISNTDVLGREWGQTYFVSNPNESPCLRSVSQNGS